ncbi:MAG: VWA domain-containing protein [Bryobacteraceae bacterium]
MLTPSRERKRADTQSATILCLAGILFCAGAVAQAQPAGAPAGAQTVIRTETRLVLVDTVVTDKKGAYIHDLVLKDFRVWEDNKEQSIKSFSFEADPASPSSSQERYLVLFFDNSTMNPGDQLRARQAAARFIDNNAGSNRLMAVVNFGGTVQIAQNFTSDADRLRQVVSGVKSSAVSPNVEVASIGMPRLGRAASDYGARSVVLALRSLAKNLADVPGRKTLILFTAGFPLNSEIRSEVTAAIDACNKANVAIYPIDVRGLAVGGFDAAGPRGALVEPRPAGVRAGFGFLRAAAFVGSSPGWEPQTGGGGQRGGTITTGGSPGGGSGSRSGGGTAGGSTPGGRTTTGGAAPGGRTTTGGTATPGGTTTGNRSAPSTGGGNPTNRNTMVPGQAYRTNPFNLPRQIVPPVPFSATANQEVLYMLGDGTGGFVIANTNDLLGGLEKIGKEQNEYYILAYTPAESPEGSCHSLRVKVDRGGTSVRARSGYCNVKPVDLLAGKPVEQDLENRAIGSQPGTVTASMQAPFFYTSPNTARVDVAIEIPSESLKFEKVKGKLHSEVNVLGIAYKLDGAIAARFSDTVKLDLENQKELAALKQKPLHYENQFDVASGQYNFKVVFSSGGESFGKLEQPLVVDPNDGTQFGLSALALSKEVHRVSELETALDAELLEGRAPLVASGFQFTPTGANRFKTTDPATMYLEIYEPLLVGANPPRVGVQLRLLDRKTGEQKVDSGIVEVASFMRAGNPVIPVGLKLPLASLIAGSYRVELTASDSVGKSVVRSADFEIE